MLENFYKYLEENANGLYSLSISNRLKREYNFLGKKVSNEILWEQISARFILEDGQILPILSSTKLTDNNETIPLDFPDQEDLDKKAYEYYYKRTKVVKNDFLRIRYLQILFNGKHRFHHTDQPKAIIDISLKIVEGGVSNENDDKYKTKIDLLRNGMHLSVRAKNYRLEEIKQRILEVLDERTEQILVIQLMLDSIYKIRKKIGNDFINDVLTRMNPWIDYLLKRFDTMIGPTFIDSVSKYDVSLGGDIKKYHQYKGRLYEGHAESKYISGEIAKAITLTRSIKEYTLAGDKKSIERVGLKYIEVKKNVKLDKVRFKIEEDKREYLELHLNSILNFLKEKNTEEVLGYISNSTQLLPNHKKTTDSDQIRLSDFATNAYFDKNNNVKVSSGMSQEAKYFESYSFEFQLFYRELINSVFVENIHNGKISAIGIIKYLNNHSWLGQVLELSNKDGEVQKYSWINEIGNTVLEFFGQLEASIISKNYRGNYVMCVDSLVLKFEPILRDLAQRRGINTTNIKNDTLQEIYMEELLRILEEKGEISNQNTVFFKYLYTKNGQNVRNDIAHGFMKSHNYGYFLFILTLFSILRLSAFKLTKK